MALTQKELDLAVTAKLQAPTLTNAETSCSNKMARERKLVHTQYMHFGHSVCRDFFISLHSIGKDILVNIAGHMRENGLVSKTIS